MKVGLGQRSRGWEGIVALMAVSVLAGGCCQLYVSEDDLTDSGTPDARVPECDWQGTSCGRGKICDESTFTCISACPDADGDGHEAASCGGDDCDDDDAERFPGNVETCDPDDHDHDEDCDHNTVGDTDADQDSYVSDACCNISHVNVRRCGTDCDDGSATVNPYATEVCNDVDDDCSGAYDDSPDFLCVVNEFVPCDPPDGPAGVITCNATCDGFSDCIAGDEGPSVDGSCNGRDDDGDSQADENFFCVQGASEACTTSCGTPGTRVCEMDCGSFGPCESLDCD